MDIQVGDIVAVGSPSTGPFEVISVDEFSDGSIKIGLQSFAITFPKGSPTPPWDIWRGGQQVNASKP